MIRGSSPSGKTIRLGVRLARLMSPRTSPRARPRRAGWPDSERPYLTYRRIDTGPAPKGDLLHGEFVATAMDPGGHRYAVSYRAKRFDNYIPGPLAFDMGWRVATGSLIGISIFSLALTFYLRRE